MMPYVVTWIPKDHDYLFDYFDIQLELRENGKVPNVTRFHECEDQDFTKFGNISLKEEKESLSISSRKSKFFCVKGFEDAYLSGIALRKNFSQIVIEMVTNEKYDNLINIT